MNMQNMNAVLERDTELKKLISLSKEGDEEAFGRVYDVLAEPVYKFIYMRIRHREIAEDLLSLTFLKAWKNITQYEERYNVKFSTWLFQISHNTIRDYWRSRRDEVGIENYMQKEIHDSTVEERIDTALQCERIRTALQRLSENYQNVLTLRFINGLSVGETAVVMQKTNGSVRVLQTRALQSLKKVMKS